MKVKSPVASRRLDLSLCLEPSLGQNALAEPAMDAPTMDNAPCIAWQHLLHRYSTADRAQAEHASIPGFADGLCAKRCPVCVAGATCRHTLTSSYTNFPCKKIIGPGVAIEAQLVHFMLPIAAPRDICTTRSSAEGGSYLLCCASSHFTSSDTERNPQRPTLGSLARYLSRNRAAQTRPHLWAVDSRQASAHACQHSRLRNRNLEYVGS